jgi:hypothetical protein
LLFNIKQTVRRLFRRKVHNFKQPTDMHRLCHKLWCRELHKFSVHDILSHWLPGMCAVQCREDDIWRLRWHHPKAVRRLPCRNILLHKLGALRALQIMPCEPVQNSRLHRELPGHSMQPLPCWSVLVHRHADLVHIMHRWDILGSRQVPVHGVLHRHCYHPQRTDCVLRLRSRKIR